MPEKHDNQYTTPPLTWDEALSKARQLFRVKLKGPGYRDWIGIWMEWCFTEPSRYPTTNSWVNDPATQEKYKGLHEQSIQERGGKLWWKECREAFRFKAFARLIEKAPDIIARSLEKDIEAVSAVRKTAMRLDGEINKLLDSGDEKKKAALEARVATLAETITLLAEANMKLIHGGVDRHRIESVNIHATLVQALKDRDGRFGVVESNGQPKDH